nr:MAG TPA: hypothetical protein [Caudoviricetes sp.]
MFNLRFTLGLYISQKLRNRTSCFTARFGGQEGG